MRRNGLLLLARDHQQHNKNIVTKTLQLVDFLKQSTTILFVVELLLISIKSQNSNPPFPKLQRRSYKDIIFVPIRLFIVVLIRISEYLPSLGVL